MNRCVYESIPNVTESQIEQIYREKRNKAMFSVPVSLKEYAVGTKELRNVLVALSIMSHRQFRTGKTNPHTFELLRTSGLAPASFFAGKKELLDLGILELHAGNYRWGDIMGRETKELPCYAFQSGLVAFLPTGERKRFCWALLRGVAASNAVRDDSDGFDDLKNLFSKRCKLSEWAGDTYGQGMLFFVSAEKLEGFRGGLKGLERLGLAVRSENFLEGPTWPGYVILGNPIFPPSGFGAWVQSEYVPRSRKLRRADDLDRLARAEWKAKRPGKG